MGWLTFIRFSLVFLLTYCAVPGLIRGRRPGKRWGLVLAETFVGVAFIQEFAVLLLGSARLALPGALVLVYAGTLAAFAIDRLRRDAKRRTAEEWIRNLAGSWSLLPSRCLRRVVRFMPPLIPNATIAVSLLVAAGWFAIHNVRLPDLESYSRALSLGVVANGGPWRPDPTVAWLLTPGMFSALPAPLVIGASTGIIAAFLAAAAGFASFEFFRSRLCSTLTTGCAGLVVILMPQHDSTAGMAATLLLFSAGLAMRSRLFALAATVAGMSISTSTAVWQTVTACIASVLLAGAISLVASRGSIRVRRFAVWMASAFCVVWLGALTDRVPQPAAPQYEAAARACQTIASTYSRNSWLIVSPAQELACTYGTGWHVELQQFVQQHTSVQAADPAFRFHYPVADVFFFIEKKPLRPRVAATSTQFMASATGDANLRPAEHASLEFEATDILAAYASTHSDLRQIYGDESISIYHAGGSLTSGQPNSLTTN
jgi:hypothetical protein